MNSMYVSISVVILINLLVILIGKDKYVWAAEKA